MSIPNSNFEGIFSSMCLARYFDNIENWKLIVGHRDIYYAKKNIKCFRMCGV